jgi:arsenate reductase
VTFPADDLPTQDGDHMSHSIDRRAVLAMFSTALPVAAWAAEKEGAKKLRILVLCTGNSARSQMTEGFLKSFDSRLEVYSAGTSPSPRVNPHAVRVMSEVGIDISGGHPKKADQFVTQPFDYVITVCDDADKNCPYFTGKVGKRMHIGFPDPAVAKGTDEEILAVFRRVRDDIQAKFRELHDNELKAKLA